MIVGEMSDGEFGGRIEGRDGCFETQKVAEKEVAGDGEAEVGGVDSDMLEIIEELEEDGLSDGGM